MVPPGFSHTLSKTSQISKIISFLLSSYYWLNSFCPLPPLKNFLPTLLRVTVKIELLSSSTMRSVKLEDELDLASTTSSLLGALKKGTQVRLLTAKFCFLLSELQLFSFTRTTQHTPVS